MLQYVKAIFMFKRWNQKKCLCEIFYSLGAPKPRKL